MDVSTIKLLYYAGADLFELQEFEKERNRHEAPADTEFIDELRYRCSWPLLVRIVISLDVWEPH
jgi:hypothetical protein